MSKIQTDMRNSQPPKNIKEALREYQATEIINFITKCYLLNKV